MGDDLETLGVIHTLRHHIFVLFLTHHTQYVSMNTVLHVRNECHFLNPPTPSPSTLANIIYGWSMIWGPLGLPKRVPNQFACGIYGQNYVDRLLLVLYCKIVNITFQI
jgi:hypothetical protein